MGEVHLSLLPAFSSFLLSIGDLISEAGPQSLCRLLGKYTQNQHCNSTHPSSEPQS